MTRLERFRESPFEFVFSVPPRHGKSVLILHFIVWALLIDPTLNIAYVTYSEEQARSMSAEALKIADEAGLHLSKKTDSLWRTPKNKYVLWTGIGGALTGKGFQIIIVDDPVKNRAEAESPTYRQRNWDFFQSDLYSRLQPAKPGDPPGSICVIQTRWHYDDLAGHLSRGDEGEEITPWDTINIPAISNEDTDDEQALWPEMWPIERLQKIRSRVGPYAWSSLYQGHPMPRGASVFGDPSYFAETPKFYRAAHGVDLAYTEKKKSDYSVVVTMLRDSAASKDQERYFVVRVRRRQMKAPEFKAELRAARAEFPGPMRWYAAGTEKGSADFFISPPDPVPLSVLQPVGDKFTRAIPLAAAWNAGKVLLPSPELMAANPGKYDWVNDFLDEVKVFTGTKDKHDDQVDAAGAAYDEIAIAGPMFSGQKMPGRSL